MKVSDKTLEALALSLNLRKMRQEVITANIANAETPGYKAKRLDFEDALHQALDLEKLNSMNKSDTRHFNVGGGGLKSVKPEVYEDPNGIVSEDGNTVNRDDELARMAENKILYDTAVQLLNKKFGQMRYVLTSER